MQCIRKMRDSVATGVPRLHPPGCRTSERVPCPLPEHDVWIRSLRKELAWYETTGKAQAYRCITKECGTQASPAAAIPPGQQVRGCPLQNAGVFRIHRSYPSHSELANSPVDTKEGGVVCGY